MKESIARILRLDKVTHDVIRFTVEKPVGYAFTAGLATEVSVNKPKLKIKKRPFTFTNLNDNNYIEFTIKIYAEHKGVTLALSLLKPGDELILRDVWGAIHYQGPGTFIAGGAGITPFIAIFRQLNKEDLVAGNNLIYSNKTVNDITLKDEFTKLLANNFTNTLTREKKRGYHYGRIDQAFLKKKIIDFKQHFYICGPGSFVQDVSKHLLAFGASPSTLVIEK